MNGKGGLFILGFLLPFFLFFQMKKRDLRPQPDLFSAEPCEIPPSLWLILPLLALAFRFLKFDTFFVWPGWDESLKGLLATGLQRGGGGFFQGFDQSPPTFIAGVGLLWRWTHSPLFSLWFLPALASFFSVILCWLAARNYFSCSLSLLCASGMAFGYWPLLTGRIGFEWSFFILWECLLFYLLGLWSRSRGAGPRKEGALLILLGLSCGGCSLVTNSWPILAFAVAGIVLVLLLKDRTRGFRLVLFFTGFLTALLPFLFAATREGYGGHISSLFLIHSMFDWKQPLLTAWGYLSAFFWGSNAAYVPREMGLFNPLSGAFFLIGLLELCHSRWDFRARTIHLLLLFFSLPAFLLGGVEPFRLVQLLPLFLLVIGLGIQALLLGVKPGKRLPLLLMILLFSGSLDLYRLARPYWDLENHPDRFAETGKSLEKLRAYQILSVLQALHGPGLVFSEMVPETGDLSLAYMSLPFNAARRPGIPLGQIHWAAFLAPVHYSPYLSQLFPGMHGTLLPSQISGRVSDHFLGVVPLTTQNLPVFQRWLSASQILWEADSRIIHLSDGKSRREVLEGLGEAYQGYPRDPFLQSCYFEKLLYNYSWEKTFHPEDGWANWRNFSGVFGESYRKGLADPVLAEKYGALLSSEGLNPGSGNQEPN